MGKKPLPILFCLILCTCFAWPQGVRKAVWAGMFYNKNAEVLSRQIDALLKKASKKSIPSNDIITLIAPHAAYMYSGQIAASAYSLVQGKDYETVIVIGPSHRHGFHGCSIYPQGGYETPLGVAKIDQSLALELSRASGFKYIAEAHKKEHSVEVQVPFIQKTLPQAKIVPVVMGFPTKSTITGLTNALVKVSAGKKILVVASTDMSHHLPKKRANDIDSNTISLIQSFRTNLLLRKIQKGENIMCGGGPVVSTLLYAQKKGKPKAAFVDYADSSQFGGPESQVVGYFAAAIYLEGPPPEFSLSEEEKEELLELAHSAIKQYIQEHKVFTYRTKNQNFLTDKGAFVTLKKRGRLRGCIGFIEPILPLYQTVIQAAIYAACKDGRFPPVSPSEVKDLEIEISVLSPLKKIHSPNLIEVGKHGLFISRESKKGLLLPQVPVENNWSREEFLKRACLKAGLPPDSWKYGADMYIFEAIIFQ